ncbi:MAG TPA: DUF3341 domain-containing protein [Gemmatimonadales bacterium]|jgi:hypothetical protein|nr:DUF3341 domain-containing protein [Gemmatimonadales bacterium]
MARRPKVLPGVLGSFEQIDAATDAIKALRAGGHKDLVVYCSHPNHELEAALETPVSPVRLFTLIGGLTGCTAGFTMTIWMNLDWPLLVGGKAFASVPAFVPIGFELTVLIGALSTVLGVVLLILLLGKQGVMYDPRFSDDRIGVFVPAPQEKASSLEQLMRDAGAVEVRYAAP